MFEHALSILFFLTLFHFVLHFWNGASFQGSGEDIYAIRYSTNLVWAVAWAATLGTFMIWPWLAILPVAFMIVILLPTKIMRTI